MRVDEVTAVFRMVGLTLSRVMGAVEAGTMVTDLDAYVCGLLLLCYCYGDIPEITKYLKIIGHPRY